MQACREGIHAACMHSIHTYIRTYQCSKQAHVCIWSIGNLYTRSSAFLIIILNLAGYRYDEFVEYTQCGEKEILRESGSCIHAAFLGVQKAQGCVYIRVLATKKKNPVTRSVIHANAI